MRQAFREKRGGGVSTRIYVTHSPFDCDGASCEQAPRREFYFPCLFAVRFVFASGQQSFLSRPSFEKSWLEKQRSPLSNLRFRNGPSANPGKTDLKFKRQVSRKRFLQTWAHRKSTFLILVGVQKLARTKCFAT